MNRAIYRFDLIPSLSGHDFRQVRSAERLLISRGGDRLRRVRRREGRGRGERGGSAALALTCDEEGWMMERDVDPVDANRPIQVGRSVFEIS